MSKTEIEKYLATYDEILESMVDLHNKHMIYKFRQGRESVRELRKSAKKLTQLHKQLQDTAMSSYYEFRKNTMERLARKREERKLKESMKKT